MNKQDLQQRQSDIEHGFNKLAQQKTDIEDEMKRLQGEYRLVASLIETATVKDEKPRRLRKIIEAEEPKADA